MEPITIRSASYYDLFEIEALGRHGLEEAGQLYPAYDLPHMLRGFITSIERGLVFVATEKVNEAREKIVGALIVGICTWPQNPRVEMIENEHLYVLPDYRSRATATGIPVGTALINIMKQMAEAAGVPAHFRQTFGGDHVEARARLAERSGFTTIGTNHVFMPKAKAEDAAA
jgi:GNAT superfamily N-acetyltransferase